MFSIIKNTNTNYWDGFLPNNKIDALHLLSMEFHDTLLQSNGIVFDVFVYGFSDM